MTTLNLESKTTSSQLSTQKELLSLTLDQLKFKTQSRDSLYFGKFQYQALYRIQEGSGLRDLDHNKIDSILFFREQYQRWRNSLITQQTKDDLHTVCDQFLSLKTPYKKIIYGNWIYFYTNDLNDILTLGAGPMTMRPEVNQAVVTRPKDTIALQHPQHSYRTYLRSIRVSAEQSQSLASFLNHNKEYLAPSSALSKFLNKSQHRDWTLNYYFIDHSDMKLVTALRLINPDLISITKQIVMVNNNTGT